MCAEPDPGPVRPDQTDDERATVWGFIWVLFAFKILTVAATMWAAGLTSEATYILSITTWPWLIIPSIAFSGTLLYQYRVRRVRRRRAKLQLSEWMIGADSLPGQSVPVVVIGKTGERHEYGD